MLRRLPQGISLLRSRRPFLFLKVSFKISPLDVSAPGWYLLFSYACDVHPLPKCFPASFPLAQSPTYVSIQLKHQTTNTIGRIFHSIQAPPTIGPAALTWRDKSEQHVSISFKNNGHLCHNVQLYGILRVIATVCTNFNFMSTYWCQV